MNAESGLATFEDDSHTRFRILSVGKKRRGFALEPIFWTMLETIARERNLRLSDLMEQIIEHKGSCNMSSALRTASAQLLFDELKQMREATLTDLGNRITALVPSPAFIIDRNKKIIAANNALRSVLKQTNLEPSQKLDAEIRLGAPISRLLLLFEEKPQAVYQVDYTIANARVSITGRLSTTLFEASRSRSSIMCVIAPDHLRMKFAGS